MNEAQTNSTEHLYRARRAFSKTKVQILPLMKNDDNAHLARDMHQNFNREMRHALLRH